MRRVAIERSRQFPDCYRKVADEKGCIFLDAAKFIYPSKTDSLHLTAEGHITLAEKMGELINGIK